MKLATVKFESLTPNERNKIAEPLDAFLREKNYGYVDGGGSGFDSNRNIAYSEIHLTLNETDKTAIKAIRKKLKESNVLFALYFNVYNS